VAPVLLGGGQERGLRSGTEDLASIAGLAAAADIMAAEMATEVPRIKAIRDRLVERVLDEIPDSHLNGHPTERLPNNAHFRFDAVEGEAMVLSLRDAASRLHRLGLQLQDARAVPHAHLHGASPRGSARLARSSPSAR
jgi:cysteine sulfinate desulfinase/cysteine desulfurase-like protein